MHWYVKKVGFFVNGLLEILLSFGFGSYCNCYRSKLNSGFFKPGLILSFFFLLALIQETEIQLG